MPRERRPGDVIGAAVKVMRILASEEPEDYDPETGKDNAAKSLGARAVKTETLAGIASGSPSRRLVYFGVGCPIWRIGTFAWLHAAAYVAFCRRAIGMA